MGYHQHRGPQEHHGRQERYSAFGKAVSCGREGIGVRQKDVDKRIGDCVDRLKKDKATVSQLLIALDDVCCEIWEES